MMSWPYHITGREKVPKARTTEWHNEGDRIAGFKTRRYPLSETGWPIHCSKSLPLSDQWAWTAVLDRSDSHALVFLTASSDIVVIKDATPIYI